MILDLGGVSGSTGRRRDSTVGATSQSGPIDVSDNPFRSDHWKKWSTIRERNLRCGLCDDTLDPLVRPQQGTKSDERIISTTCFAPPATAPMWPTCCASHHYARHRPSCCRKQGNVPAATLVSSGGKSSGAHMLGEKDPKPSRRSYKRSKTGLYGKAAAKRWIKATRAQVRPLVNSAWIVPRSAPSRRRRCVLGSSGRKQRQATSSDGYRMDTFIDGMLHMYVQLECDSAKTFSRILL